jgi:hypothetical protein
MAAASAPVISGYVDTQYSYNWNKPITGMTNLRSYDAQDNTISNTAHLSLTGTGGDGIGYVVDLDAGHDPATTVGGVSSSGVGLQEAYLTYLCPITHIGVKAGKFVTYEGIEVIETNANPTISRGYLFGMAEPFTHVGGVLTYVAGKLDFAVGAVNGWDLPNDNNKGKTLVGKIGFNFGDPFTATLSGYHGPEQAQVSSGTAIIDSRSGFNRDSVDLTVLTKLIPKVDLWLQANAGTEKGVVDNDADGINESRATWKGAGVQPLIHFGDKFTIGARLEYFDDPQGVRTGTGLKNICATNFTVTPGYKLTDNVQVRAEYRYDTSNKKIWVDDKGTAKDSTSTTALQFVYAF